MLQQVDSLEFIVLVDNNVEWMSPLPPNFSSEIRLHMEANPPIDPLTQVPVLDLDHFCCGAHGLSILIKTHSGGETYHTLFDTGPDGAALARNLDALNIDLQAVDRIVLSHWHRDHSGGILEFLKKRHGSSEMTVDLHPSRPIARGIAPPPTYDKVLVRLPEDPTVQEIRNLGATVDESDEPRTVQGDTVFVSGQIPRITEWEKGLLGGVRWLTAGEPSEGGWKAEPDILDERYVAIDVAGKGLVVFSACSHAGICNVVANATKRLQRPIYAVVGGLHLAGPELAGRIPPTVEYLKSEVQPPLTYVVPLHCTGAAARVALVNAFGDKCVAAGVGIRARLGA